ncbi:hypothetical protein N7520_002837 [Penicillium odoratum]|uniref:uncharacterized protein n=1 Tax=Penicillium odoratum TaxID=1167516 RepID=UPI002547EEA4|nr:uncharacterized protein N7520_002837 [Penicillium odoratum]KAJ5772308.1 hypothetical protein N7520_002837 [Penicillium odoratum]
MDAERYSDTSSKYPVMMPTAQAFNAQIYSDGIYEEDILVVYDTYEVGLYSAPRVAWTYMHFGYRNVHVLNNFTRYANQGFAISNDSLVLCSKPVPWQTIITLPQARDPREVISFEELRDLVLKNSAQRHCQILDARPFHQFSGLDATAYESLPPGHMPDALSIPLASLLTEDKSLRPVDELRTIFSKAGVDEEIPVVLTCNSGVTASALGLALRECGYQMDMRLYDGSWMEWADRVSENGLIVTN